MPSEPRQHFAYGRFLLFKVQLQPRTDPQAPGVAVHRYAMIRQPNRKPLRTTKRRTVQHVAHDIDAAFDANVIEDVPGFGVNTYGVGFDIEIRPLGTRIVPIQK